MIKIFAPLIVPTPITGMTTINEKIYNYINTQKLYEAKGVFSKPRWIRNNTVWLLYKNLYLIYVAFSIPFMRLRGYKILYNVPASGNALFLSFFIFIMGMLFMKKIVHHHHVFYYINKKNKWIALIEKIGSNKVYNIFLCDYMKDKYKKLYNTNTFSLVLDNIYFSTEKYMDKNINKTLRIGYLSNITIEKGFDIFVDTVKEVLKRNKNIKFLIAGPVKSIETQNLLDTLLNTYPLNIKYIGSVYNDKKNIFFSDIDIFLFPAKNEAQPLVIYEAIEKGCIVLSIDIGCISEQLPRSSFFTNKESFIKNVISIVNNDNILLNLKNEQKINFNNKLLFKDKILNEFLLFIA